MARLETQSGLGLLDLTPPEIRLYQLTKIQIRQPDLCITYPRTFNLRGLFSNSKDQTLWILYGPPDDEPNLQTLSWRNRSTEIQFTYQNGFSRCYTVKIGL